MKNGRSFNKGTSETLVSGGKRHYLYYPKNVNQTVSLVVDPS
jgi:hypothetical protein